MGHILGHDVIIAEVVNGQSTPLAAAKSCEIDKTADAKEISSVTSGQDREFVAGRRTWRVTVNYLVPASGEAMSKLDMVGGMFNLSMYIRGRTDDKRSGNALLIESKITATDGNLVQGSWVFQGSGALA